MRPHELAANLERVAKDIAHPKALFDALGPVIVAKIKPHVRVRTGVLQGSIAYRLVDNNTLFVGSAVPYAPFVDARYPFLQPGLDDAQGDIDRITADWGEKVLSKAAG
jgi:hypothetical protein